MPQKKSSIAAALERAKSTLTQEVMRKAMSELPLGTPMGVIVGSLRSAGFGKVRGDDAPGLPGFF